MQAMPRCHKATSVMMLVALLFVAHPACAAPADGDQAKSAKLFAT